MQAVSRLRLLSTRTRPRRMTCSLCGREHAGGLPPIGHSSAALRSWSSAPGAATSLCTCGRRARRKRAPAARPSRRRASCALSGGSTSSHPPLLATEARAPRSRHTRSMWWSGACWWNSGCANLASLASLPPSRPAHAGDAASSRSCQPCTASKRVSWRWATASSTQPDTSWMTPPTKPAAQRAPPTPPSACYSSASRLVTTCGRTRRRPGGGCRVTPPTGIASLPNSARRARRLAGPGRPPSARSPVLSSDIIILNGYPDNLRRAVVDYCDRPGYPRGTSASTTYAPLSRLCPRG